MNTPNDYLPILIQIGVAVGFVVLTLGVSHLLGPNRKTAKREDNFECGIENQGNARFPVSVKYFLSAILFVLFDVEVIFFYPYAVNFKEMGWRDLVRSWLSWASSSLASFMFGNAVPLSGRNKTKHGKNS